MRLAGLERSVKEFICWDEGLDPEVRAPFRRSLKWLALLARPNIAFRYRPVLAYLKRQSDLDTVLEVGSGSVGITRYVSRPVTGLDVSFSGPKNSDLCPVEGSAVDMPFPDSSFDHVISLDMIEHLDPAARDRAIAEMIRVATRTVIVGCPSGRTARIWEEKARQVCERSLARGSAVKKELVSGRADFLYEHLEHGLPEIAKLKSSIVGALRSAGRAGHIETKANQSVLVWYLMALGMMRLSPWYWLVSTLFGLALMPLLSRVGWGGHYRQIIYVTLDE